MYDVVAIGELLVDFCTPGDQPNCFEANPGGAPANALAMLNRLGCSTALIAKVGDDAFGKQLIEAVAESGTDTGAIRTDRHYHTTLAFVHRTSSGDRTFSFYRNPGADRMLKIRDIPCRLPTDCRIFHFGAVSLTDPLIRRTTLYAVRRARRAGVPVSFDPNYRPALWRDKATARRVIRRACSLCDVLKISDDELTFLTGCTDSVKGMEELRRFCRARLIFVTEGRTGSRAFWEEGTVFEPAVYVENVVDATGAGDTFCGCILAWVLRHGLEKLQKNDLIDLLRFANAAASLVVRRRGALLAMPTQQEIDAVLQAQ